VESAWINNAYPRARTAEKSTAVAARGASPRTPAIAHTYLYTVIFKMKERRAGGRVVVVVVLVGVVECTLTDDGGGGREEGDKRRATTTADQSHFQRTACCRQRASE